MFFGYPDTPNASPFKPAFAPDTPPPRVAIVQSGETSWLGIATTPPPPHISPSADGNAVKDRSDVVSYRDGHSFAQCPVHSREIVHLRLRLVYLDELLARKGADLDLAAEASSGKALVEMLRSDNAALQHRIRELEGQVSALEEAQADAKVRLNDLDADLQRRPALRDVEKARERADTVQRELESTQAQLAALHEEFTCLSVSFKASRTEAAEAAAALRAEAREMVEAEARRGQERVAEVCHQRDGLRQLLESNEKELMTLRGESQSRDGALRESRALLAAADAMIKDLNSKVETLEADAAIAMAASQAAARDKASLSNAISRLVTACTAVERELGARPTAHVAATGTAASIADLSVAAVLNTQPSEVDAVVAGWQRRCLALATAAGVAAVETLAAGIRNALEDAFCAPIERHIRNVAYRSTSLVATTDMAKQRILRRVAWLRRRGDTAEASAVEAKERLESEGAARVAENAALISEIGNRMQHTIEDRVRNGLAEIRANIINTNVLTKDFVDRVENVVNRAANVVRDMHDRQDAYPRGASGAGGGAYDLTSRSQSPGVRSTSSQVSSHGYLASADMLAQQCGNIAILLRTNLAQADEQESRFGSMLAKLRDAIGRDLDELHQRLKASRAQAGPGLLQRPSSFRTESSLLPSPQQQRSPVGSQRLFSL